ncbi:anthranilate synthase component I family protein [Phragmitibacter flavus]|uniref:Anthranilate synthase component I family protein n=1 Tax=Phragmitibacter flavus TaxID=2576071 RepID=A0A5R8KJA0_9BACT|nr:anthranilate synthase component I family protein [Phragmitibacter flavus]TLD72362.1 anthranilate synthase component I family protein [Phragmitibacter flavus]
MTVLSAQLPVAAAFPAPVQVAASWRGREGLAFLDSSMRSGEQGRSMIAVEPESILRGRLMEDADGLKRLLKERKGEPGGLFGWVGFDGAFVFGVYDRTYVFDHARQVWCGEAPELGGGGDDETEGGLEGRLKFGPLMEKSDFCGRVERALEYIAAGDIYQVNLSYPWEAMWPEGRDAWGFYERLRAVSPAPHSAFYDLDGVQICCASPECFLTMEGRRVVTRPIKGTRPRGADAASDWSQAADLLASPKERAELVMITDLLRNDLGRVCEFGSVKVSGLCELERYAQVQHLVSTVEGELRPEVDHVEALLQCFPGGSISGAPKKRALEIIGELEPNPRGIYTGAMGYFGFDGTSQFNIVIRTAWVQGDRMRFYTGAGIVADSVPEREWEETQHKAAGLLKAAERF